MKRKCVFTLVLIIMSIFCLIITGCSNEKNIEGFNFDEKTFMSNWNSWKAQNIQNYSFILHGGTGSFDSLITPLDAHMPFSFKIIVLNGIMNSFEIITNGGIGTPPFTSISHMYQSIYDSVQENKKWFEKNGHEVINSITINVGYGSMYYITFYGKTYDYKKGHEVSENGLTYRISDFQTIEHGGV